MRKTYSAAFNSMNTVIPVRIGGTMFLREIQFSNTSLLSASPVQAELAVFDSSVPDYVVLI